MGKDLLPERHFVLYARRAYKREGTYSELKVLTAHYTKINIPDVNEIDVLYTVCDIVQPCTHSNSLGLIVHQAMNAAVSAQQPEIVSKLEHMVNEICQYLISVYLKHTQNRGMLINLGEPDPSILPVHETKAAPKNVGDHPFSSGG